MGLLTVLRLLGSSPAPKQSKSSQVRDGAWAEGAAIAMMMMRER